MNGNDRAITGFTMIAHAAFHVYELAIPLFIVVWLNVFDVTPAVIGTVVGVVYGTIGVGALISGISPTPMARNCWSSSRCSA